MTGTTTERELLVVSRFKVLGFLCKVEEADFSTIEAYTELTAPEISKSLKFLEQRLLVQTRKERRGPHAFTVAYATDSGFNRFRTLIKGLQKFSVEV